MVLLEQIGRNEERHEEQAKLVLVVVLIDDPAVDEGELF